MAHIISADEIKKKLAGYSPQKAEFFHHESAKLADQLFEKALTTNPYKEVILLSGGTASGKTEFLATQLHNKRCIILDATLSTEEGAKIKLKKILKAKKVPIIYAVIPDDLKRAFIAFLNRDRKFSDEHFYKTHSGCRKTLLWITLNFPSVKINIIESSYAKNQLQFAKIGFGTQKQFSAYLTSLQLTESDILYHIQKGLYE